ncbi:glutathione S-transferase N-terminal domain-containing protein [Metabacillus sp. RGM 3146]|uniref:glutathione S-transferase N-terminal domain-containing protein n=1 Tax=Metabacillus sp. RGM 3146 TaxID=3401092 RepID=UPI003B9AD83A
MKILQFFRKFHSRFHYLNLNAQLPILVDKCFELFQSAAIFQYNRLSVFSL